MEMRSKTSQQMKRQIQKDKALGEVEKGIHMEHHVSHKGLQKRVDTENRGSVHFPTQEGSHIEE